MIKQLKSRRAFKILHAYITNIELMKVNSTWKIISKESKLTIIKRQERRSVLMPHASKICDISRFRNAWDQLLVHVFSTRRIPPASSVSSGGALLLYTSYSYGNGDYNNNLSMLLGISLDASGLISCKKKSSFSRRSFDAAEKFLNSWRKAGFVHVCHDSLL